MRRRDLWIAATALAAAVLAAVVFLVVGLSPKTPATPLAGGETIYQTGIFDGRPVPHTGSGGGGMMGSGGMSAGMTGGGCASCHGSHGRGRTKATFTAPDITYANLTDPKGMVAPDGSRGPTYSDAAIRKAVTQGTDPSGARLAAPMPQWQLSDREWDALLAYLKTLH